MHKMTTLEYSYLVRELGSKLTGKYFSRIKKLSDDTYRLKIGDYELLCQLGIRLHITKYIEEAKNSDQFAEKVSKELDNARIKTIRQINNDRIISIDFERGSIVFEMFGEGNIIFVKDDIIQCAVKYEKWADREIKVGSKYSPPKASTSSEIAYTDRYIIVCLMKLPLGKEYSSYILEKLNIDEKTVASSLSAEVRSRIEGSISDLMANLSPLVFKDNYRIIDFALTKLSKFSSLNAISTSTLSDAADEYYSKAEKQNPELEKIEKRLQKQLERKELLLREEKDYKEAGDFIYSRYTEIEKILSAIKAGKIDEVESKYNVKIDKKEKTLEIDFS